MKSMMQVASQTSYGWWASRYVVPDTSGCAEFSDCLDIVTGFRGKL